jgi:hypothetical protein
MPFTGQQASPYPRHAKDEASPGEITSYGTGYTETELILAAIDGDDATIRHHIRRMTKTERDDLRQAAQDLDWHLA